jgi:hypothetical protein
MSDTDFNINERLMYQRVEEELRQARVRQLQREAGVAGLGWLREGTSTALSSLGRAFLSVGQRLEQASRAQLISAQEDADGRA